MSSRSRFILLAMAVWVCEAATVALAQLPGSVALFQQPPTLIAQAQTPDGTAPAQKAPAEPANAGQAAGPRASASGMGAVRTASMQSPPMATPDAISYGGPTGPGPDPGYGPMSDGDYFDGAGGCCDGGCGGGCGCGNRLGCSYAPGPMADNGWGCNWLGCAMQYEPRGALYIRGEYLGWWVKGDSLPALVTTSPNGTAQAAAGVLGQPGTQTLFGGNAVNASMRSGFRTAVGYQVAPRTRIEGEFLYLGPSTDGFSQSSGGNPILARPFLNLTSGAQDSFLLAYPGRSSGSVNVNESSNFLGAGIHGLTNLCCNNCCDRQYSLDVLYGFRYLRLAENLTINDSLTSIATSAPTGTVFTTFDGFKTANNFYGFDIGLMSTRRLARWSLSTVGRIGLGATQQIVNVSGKTTSTPPGGTTTTTSGGFLALPANVGSYRHNEFGFVPQLEMKLGYNLTPNFRLLAGYDILCWTRVVRPGDIVNTSVRPATVSPTPSGLTGPPFAFHESSMWIQGFSLGGDLWF